MMLQEENRIFDKTNRQKVAEVEKLAKPLVNLRSLFKQEWCCQCYT